MCLLAVFSYASVASLLYLARALKYLGESPAGVEASTRFFDVIADQVVAFGFGLSVFGAGLALVSLLPVTHEAVKP